MTCSSCKSRVEKMLSGIKGVKQLEIDLAAGTATIEMERHIPTAELQAALKDHPQYQLSENGPMHHKPMPMEEESRPWLQTYKPILLVFAYILGATLLIEAVAGEFNWSRWMQHFMAGFFLVFSFFKMLDLKGFAESYSTYDILAKKWMGWGFVYGFIELGLGLAFLTGFNPLLTNWVTFLVMSLSIVGVLQSVLNRRKIRCACLGAVFNLPMSTVTIIEDGLMIGMSLLMLAELYFL